MSEAKRYRYFPAQYARMFIDTLPSGEYVTGVDYDALAADNQRLREALDNAVDVFSDECRRRLQEIEALQQMRAALAGSKEGGL